MKTKRAVQILINCSAAEIGAVLATVDQSKTKTRTETNSVPFQSNRRRNNLMRHHPFTKLASILVVCLMVFSSAAFADEAQLMDMVKQMQKQMNDLQSTVMAQKTEIQAQKTEIQALKTQGPKITMAPGGVEAPAMSEEDFTKQFDKNLKGKIGGSDKWLKDLQFKGDLRLRYEAFNGTSDETDARNRFRYRLRYGFEKKFSDEWNAGFSLASGEAPTSNVGATSPTVTAVQNDPTSTNTTFDNNFNFKPIYIEKAYGAYNPNWAKIGPIEKLNITAGKLDNPFEKGSSDIVWDRDVKPEGIYEKIDFKILKTDHLNLKGYLTAGQFVMDEETSVSNTGDSNLFAYQLGINPEIYTGLSEKPIKLLSALSYYDFGDYAYDSNFILGGASLARGNPTANATTLAAGRFRPWEIYNEVVFDVMGKKVAPFFDWVHNSANSADDYRVAGTNGDNAWAMGITVGETKKKGDWMASYAYKYIGANAVPGFNDSDFGNSGHSDKKGNVFKLGYSLTDYLTLNGAAFFVNNLNAGTAGIRDEQQNRFQMDMSWKF